MLVSQCLSLKASFAISAKPDSCSALASCSVWTLSPSWVRTRLPKRLCDYTLNSFQRHWRPQQWGNYAKINQCSFMLQELRRVGMCVLPNVHITSTDTINPRAVASHAWQQHSRENTYDLVDPYRCNEYVGITRGDPCKGGQWLEFKPCKKNVLERYRFMSFGFPVQ